jgi:hypothetical protein
MFAFYDASAAIKKGEARFALILARRPVIT